MGSWTDRREREERELTEGEEEGVETDLSAQRNLRDEPLCYTADGHWKSSQKKDCSQVIVDRKGRHITGICNMVCLAVISCD